MDDLYDRVRKRESKKRTRRDPWTIILPAIAIIVLVAVIIAVAYWFYIDDVFYDYVADFSNSTVTINDVKIIPFEIEGDDSYILKTSTAYGLYNKLTASKQIRMTSDEPHGDGIHIEYPDGSSLSIWYTDINVSTWSRNHGILVSYVNQNGEEIRFITDRVVYSDLVYYLQNN